MEDRKILENFPLPIARGWRRCRNASEVRDRHDAAYYLFEIYLKYLACGAIAYYLSGAERDHQVNAALKGLARPSLGEWIRFLRECLKFLASQENPDPAVLAMADFFKERDLRSRSALELFNELRSFRTGEPSRKEQVNLESLLGEVVSYRNRVLGHGAPLGAERYQKFAALFAHAFEELLRLSPFLTAQRLVSFDAIEVREGARVECQVLEYMSLQAFRRQKPHVLPYGEKAPRENCLYLSREDGRLILIDPLLLLHQEDIYFLNDAAGSPEYLSYSSGERYRPSSWPGAQSELFGRILGYQVDEKKISQIGDDLEAAAKALAKPALLEGEHRLGDYRIVREIGRGAMGAVFEAFQDSLGRRVALKILPGTFALDPRRVERFHREARATARIHHPNVVPVFEVGEIDGNHYYTMEFLSGPSLDRFIQEAREHSLKSGGKKSSSAAESTTIARAVEQFAALAEGLEAAHRLGLIHRDLKPSNIILDSDGKYVLVDFGLVHETGAATLTRSGELVGTLSYMSPEQVSRGVVDARSDIYSLGATLYEVLTLRVPFRAGSEPEIQKSILFEEPVPPRRLNPRIHRDLETIVLHAMEKNPDRRYASAGELAADLRRFLRYEPIRARAQSTMTKLARRIWRHRIPITAAAGGVLLLLTTGLLGLRFYHEAGARKEAAYQNLVLGAVMSMPLGGIGARDEDEVWPDPIKKAITDLKEAIALYPRRAEAYYHRARGLHFVGRNREAAEELDRALSWDHDFIPAETLKELITRKPGPPPGSPGTALPEPGTDRPAGRGPSYPPGGDKTGTGWREVWLEAHQALMRKDWPKAIQAYTELLESHPQVLEKYLGLTIEARLGRGRAFLEARKYDEALVEIGAVEALWPKMIEPVLLLGRVFCLKGNPDKANDKFQDLFKRHPSRDEVALGAAAVFHSSGEYGQGLRWLEEMKESRRREIQRSDFLRHLGRLDEAMKVAEKILKDYGEYPEAYNSMGNCLVQRGRFEEAVKKFEQALQLDSQYFWAYNNLGIALKSLGKLDGAVGMYEKALSLNPQFSQAHYNLGVALQEQGKLDGAVASFRKALEIDGHYTKAYNLLGITLLRIGRLDDAIAECQKVIELAPKYHPPYFNLAMALDQKGETEKAIEPCRGLLEIYEKSDEAQSGGLSYQNQLARILSFLADLEGKAKKLDDARGHRARSLSIQKNLASRREAAAQELNDCAWSLLTCEPEDLRDPAAALEFARRAVELSREKDPGALDTLALAHSMNGDAARAVEIEKKALALIPASARDPDSQELRQQLEKNLARFEKESKK